MTRRRATLTRPFVLVLTLFLALIALSGCASIARVPFTKEQQAAATIPGIPNARVWSDDRTDVLLARTRSEVFSRATARSGAVDVLALSGGGSNGAFGAGLLAGWAETGTRPQFAG